MIALLACVAYSLTVEINDQAHTVTSLGECVGAEVSRVVISDGIISSADLANFVAGCPNIISLAVKCAFEEDSVLASTFTSSKLVHVTLENVKKIGKHAFKRCTKLTTFVAPEVTCIEREAFAGCISLDNVDFPKLCELHKDAFIDCQKLSAFAIPVTVKFLECPVFQGCTAMTTLYIGTELKVLPEELFYGLHSLKNVFVPTSVEASDVHFDQSVNITLIKPGNYCPESDVLNVPSFANHVGDEAYMGCSNIKKVFVPDTIKTIGIRAFANLTFMNELTFAEPSSLVYLGNESFAGSMSLLNVRLPKSLKMVGRYIFENSMGLRNIDVYYEFDLEWFSQGILEGTWAKVTILYDRTPAQEPTGPSKYPPFPTRAPEPEEPQPQAEPKPKRADKKENIVFFFSDQQRWDTIGPNGQKLDITPYLDQLAREGVNFKNCFCNQPVCGPLRAIIQSGCYATEVGCYRNSIALPLDIVTLPKVVKEAGYSIAYIGKWHLASNLITEKFEKLSVPPERRGGWDEYWVGSDVLEFTSHGYGGYMWDGDGNKRSFTGYRTDCVTDFALEYIRNYDDEKPFFLFLSHIEPHHQNDNSDFEGPEGSKERFKHYERPPDLTPGKGDWEKWMPDYLGCCWALDKNLGRVIEALKDKGIYDDTMIIYTSDHGCHFKVHADDVEFGGGDDYKRNAYEASLHIPFVIKGRDFKPGTVEEKLISSIDFPPTLVRAAGGKIPEHWRGRPIQEVGEDDWDNVVYAQISESFVGRAIRTDRWKYVVHAKWRMPYLEPGGDYCDWTDKHLYDLKNDPIEAIELKDNPEYFEIKKQLREILIRKAFEAGEGNFQIRDE